MSKNGVSIVVVAAALAACSTVGQLTVKDYQAKSGQRVMAGQAEPKAVYQCQKLAQDGQAGGMKGNMEKQAPTHRVTAAPVAARPGREGNSLHVIPPSD